MDSARVLEQQPTRSNYEIPPECIPDMESLITEDDTPVDILSQRQQALLTAPLYEVWKGGEQQRPFLAIANVGLFYSMDKPPFVPDMMLSMDVEGPVGVLKKEDRSYFLWKYGKMPDVVVEIVSNKEGEELGRKRREYAIIGIKHYVVFDPFRELGKEVLRVFRLHGDVYRRMKRIWFPVVGLGMTLWQGRFRNTHTDWLRCVDGEGEVVPTGAELAAREKQEADHERKRAEKAEQRAEKAEHDVEQERLRAQRLVQALAALGVDPEKLEGASGS
jgi:Uma2 family endonuclease